MPVFFQDSKKPTVLAVSVPFRQAPENGERAVGIFAERVVFSAQPDQPGTVYQIEADWALTIGVRSQVSVFAGLDMESESGDHFEFVRDPDQITPISEGRGGTESGTGITFVDMTSTSDGDRPDPVPDPDTTPPEDTDPDPAPPPEDTDPDPAPLPVDQPESAAPPTIQGRPTDAVPGPTQNTPQAYLRAMRTPIMVGHPGFYLTHHPIPGP